MFNLNGKTAFISGASSGLGENFARCLSNAGARVILASRRLDKLKSLSKSIPNSLAISLDVSCKNEVEQTLLDLERSGERIDICINSAGIAKHTRLFDHDLENDFESIMQTNLMGTWYVTKAVSMHMKKYCIKGSIINIASVNGDRLPAKGASAYSVSKAAIIHMSKTLVPELSQYKIRINCISPGWFKTPMNSKEELDKISSFIPSGEAAEPNDLDGIILYLSSNEASKYVTGSCFTIDGGISCVTESW